MTTVATRLAEATAIFEADAARLHALSLQSVVVAASWSALSGIAGAVDHQLAEVPASDAGTHTDPVVGGTVANGGRYRWSTSPAGWLWLGEFQNGLYTAAAEAATGNAYSCTTDESWSSTVVGRAIYFKCPATNTDNCTFNVNSVGAISLRDNAGNQIAPGFLRLNSHYLAQVHSVTEIRVLNIAVVADALVATDAGLDPSSLNVVGVTSGGALQTISWSNLYAFIEAQLMPPTYTYPGSLTVDTAVATIVADTRDDKLVQIWGQSNGPGRIAISFGADIPAVDGSGSITIEAGQPFSMDNLRQGDVRAVADQATGLTLHIVTTGVVNPNSTLAADVHIRRYSSLTDPEEAAIRTLFGALFAGGIIDKAVDGMLGIFSGPTDADRLLNWGNVGSFSLLSAPTGSWLGYSFDGVDDGVDSGITFNDADRRTDHTACVWIPSGPTVQGSAHYAMGDTQVRIGPARTSTNATVRSFSSDANQSVGGDDGLIGLTRTDADGYTTFRNTNNVSVVAAAGATQPTTHCIVGGILSGGVVIDPYTGPVFAAYRGRALTDTQKNTLASAIATFYATAAGF